MTDGANNGKRMVLRDEQGRFLPGTAAQNPGGRPRDKVSGAVRAALLQLLTPDKVKDLAQTLVDQAVAGDHKAREHLMAFFGVDLRTLAVNMAADNNVQISVVYTDQAALANVIEGEYNEQDGADNVDYQNHDKEIDNV